MEKTTTIKWNPKVKLIISDVDETVADLFVPVSTAMADELNQLLKAGLKLFLVSGAGRASITKRVTDFIDPKLRKNVLVSHCSGAEVIGFDGEGKVLDKPFNSKYDEIMSDEQKHTWRNLVAKVIAEFKLETHNVTAVKEFVSAYGDNPLAVMLDDRGPQITLEFVNAHNLRTEQIEKLRMHIPNFDMADLRIPIMERFAELFQEATLPITPRLGGMFALDLALEGITKTTSVKHILSDNQPLTHIGITKEDIAHPSALEIWGDKYSTINGGTDRHMCEAVNPNVRAIDFRSENPEEFLPGYAIIVWQGKRQLHEGLLEYLQQRSR